MDALAANLVEALLNKTMEDMDQAARLAFVERLFSTLPPRERQEFLIRLTGKLLEDGAQAADLRGALAGAEAGADGPRGSPVVVKVIRAGPSDFAPGQLCYQALSGFASAEAPDKDEVTLIARMFNGLADETRLRIVKLLSRGEFTVEELVDALGLPQSTTSHHLKVLKDARMIRGEKKGRTVRYSLVPGEGGGEAAGTT